MELSDVVKEIEEDELNKDKIKARQLFKSMLNQPSLLSINSANAVRIGSQEGFSSFSVDLPRSVLDIDSLQLLTTSIPQCNPSLPNTALVFWYYRLSELTGTTPSLNNLYCARLLPSYYKPEFITQPANYGFNKALKSYTALQTELAKITTRDLGYENLTSLQTNLGNAPFLHFKWPFIPGDITFTYNEKFEMTGNTTRLAYVDYVAGTYNINDIVVYQNKPYISLANTNTALPTDTTKWKIYSGEVVPAWKADTEYKRGNLVRYTSKLYYALGYNFNIPPEGEGSDWNEIDQGPRIIPYNYLITGFDDPNVAIKQGEFFDMPYEQSHYYITGESVLFKGRYFKAKTETNVFVPGNVRPYDPETAYDPFSLVYFDNQFRRFNIDLTATNVSNWEILQPNPVDEPIWVPVLQPPNIDESPRLYNVGDLVYYQGRLFRALLPSTNRPPNTNPTFWRLLAEHPFNAMPFLTGLIYNLYTLAKFDGGLYMATRDGVSSMTPDDWKFIGLDVWNDYNYVDEPLQIQAGKIVYYRGLYYVAEAQPSESNYDPVPDWRRGVSYPANIYVGHEGARFLSLQPSTNNPPPFPAIGNAFWGSLVDDVWKEYDTSEMGETSGLGGLSREFDFGFLRSAGIDFPTYQQYPTGVGGQPFSPVPKRLLNSILGFTWNGVFEPALLNNLRIDIRSSVAPLYNKLRPVPNYELAIEEEELGDLINPPALTAYKYTAEGYANLVYSSIINIYTDVVSASTLDTMRNTNLVATTTMNCGNLGIAFHASYIDTPLVRVVGGDIDTLVIELRDEMDDPFYLTNNAVMTATFKINYRNRVRAE